MRFVGVQPGDRVRFKAPYGEPDRWYVVRERINGTGLLSVEGSPFVRHEAHVEAWEMGEERKAAMIEEMKKR